MKTIRNLAFLVMVMTFAAVPVASTEASMDCDLQEYPDGYDMWCNMFPYDCECPVDHESDCVSYCLNMQPAALFYQGSGCTQNYYTCDMWCACVPWP